MQNIYEPSSLADCSDSADAPDPSDLGEHTQRVFDASMTPHEAETGMSFFITKAQKAELRRRGYSEEQIREISQKTRAQGARIDWMIRGKLILRPGKSPLTHPTDSQCVSRSGTEAGREADPLTDSEAVKFRSGYAARSYSLEISLPV